MVAALLLPLAEPSAPLATDEDMLVAEDAPLKRLVPRDVLWTEPSPTYMETMPGTKTLT